MSVYRINKETLIAIADAVRLKIGSSADLTPEEMAVAIETIETNVFPHGTIPSYIKSAVADLVSKVKAKQSDNTITFLAMSDPHQLESNTDIVNGNTHAGMAAKIAAYALNLDFAAMLGDYSWGIDTTTIDEGKSHIETVNKYISEAFDGLPQFRTVGNHDPLVYSYDQNGEILSDEYLYENITKYNEGATFGSETKGYCYRDFTDKKVRVICLNTAEITEDSNPTASRISPEQQEWFASVLIDIGTKTDASDWTIIILSHHPLDWGAVCYASNILSAYVNGETITVNGSSVDFAGKNNAKKIFQVHGHLHNLKVDDLYAVDTDSWTATEQYGIKRISVPNMCFERVNEYGQNTGEDSNGIEFGTTDVFTKTADTAEDTAFCVFVYNPEKNIVDVFCYGAGEDRQVVIVSVTYTNIIANVGYTDGVRLSTSSGSTSALSGFVTTGYIPIEQKEQTIRFKGAVMATDTYQQGYAYCWYDSEKTFLASASSHPEGGGEFSVSYDSDTGISAFSGTPKDGAAYIRFSGNGSGADLICTIDEEIR